MPLSEFSIQTLSETQPTSHHSDKNLIDYDLKCGRCSSQPNPLIRTIPTLLFDKTDRATIHQYKYQNAIYLQAVFAKLMHHQLRNRYSSLQMPQALIAFPMHRSKLRKRGYNQSLLLTKQLCREFGIKNLSNQIKKIKKTQDQASLPNKDRKQNIANAFKIITPLPSHVVIIDDVMKTGETVFQLAKTLKKSGVKQVDVWCLALAT